MKKRFGNKSARSLNPQVFNTKTADLFSSWIVNSEHLPSVRTHCSFVPLMNTISTLKTMKYFNSNQMCGLVKDNIKLLTIFLGSLIFSVHTNRGVLNDISQLFQ